VSGLFFSGLPPATVAGLGVAAAAALTGLYLLRLRRRRVLVPFAPLWLPVQGERRSQRLARRLRRWLSLLLQLVFAALVLLAAADPRPGAADRAGRSLLILVDRSASMAATDEAGTRLGEARRIARALASGIGPADRAMVASFAAGAAAESAFDDDRGRLAAAVDGIAASEEPADLGHALGFAAAVLRGRPHPTLIIVSDGAFSADDRARVTWDAAPAGAPSLAGLDVRFAGVGRRADNVAILSFGARRYPADPTSVEAAVVVQSFRDRPTDTVLEITAGAARVPVDRVHLHLGPHERRRHVLPDVAAPDTRLEARLTDGGDLGADDTAFAVVPGLARWKVLHVGAPNLFLDGALLSLGDGVDVRRVPARDVEATRASWDRYDAVIFDGVAPAPAPARGRFLYLDPHGAGSPFGDRGVVREPIITDTSKGHPLLRHFSLADVNIGEARRLTIGPSDQAVASALGAPLIVARARQGLRAVAVAFDVRQSDLPMRTGFPLLLANAIGWLATPDSADAVTLRTGRRLHLPAPGGAAGAAVTDPTGATRVVPAQAGALDLPITRAGFYRVAFAGGAAGATALAANLGDPTESDTTPARPLVLGGRTLAAPDAPAPGRRRELWIAALIAAVALSLGEWWSYHRRWTV
jgi:hypothetical protein